MKLNDENAERLGKMVAEVVKTAIAKDTEELVTRVNQLEMRLNVLDAEAKGQKGKKR